MSEIPATAPVEQIYRDIRSLIESARAHVVAQVNQTLVLTYWQIGKTIKTEVLADDRAEYGDATINRLADKLVQEYGSGFGQRNLFRMARFYQQFPDLEILTTVSAKLSWSHFVELLKLEDSLKREFYLQICADARWSVRTLRERMDSMLYERTAIARQPENVINQELAQLQQHPAVEVQEFKPAHDRFLIVDDTLYHIGASLKDLGKKWFAFSRMEMGVVEMLARVRV